MVLVFKTQNFWAGSGQIFGSGQFLLGLCAGNEAFEGLLGFGPNVNSQICHFPSQNTAVYSLRSQPRRTNNFPTTTCFSPVEPSETL